MTDSARMNDRPVLEFWFEFGSNYSYLSVMRIESMANAAGVDVEWKPFLLGPVFRALGMDNSPFVLNPVKGNYAWRDMERQATKYALEFRKPSQFPRVALLPMRVAAFGASQSWIGSFSKRMMLQNFVEDLDINDASNVVRALTGLVPDPEAILALALGEDNKLRLRANTEEALRRGLFGAPSFMIGDEMFWGDDRMEDAITYAAERGAV
ncbi:MAG: 2-hydroxychromene-2-carboxylate isomerase [Pseudomonadota bacterium]